MAERVSLEKWVDRGTLAFALGGLGLFASSIIPEPRFSPELAVLAIVKGASVITMVGGGLTALSALRELQDLIPPHSHKGVNLHSHKPTDINGIPPHGHEQVSVPHHKHEASEIIVPAIDVAKQNRELIMQMWKDYNGNDMLTEELKELGLDVRTGHAITRNAIPLTKFPLTLAGLRMFREHNIPFRGRNLGDGLKGKIDEGLKRTSGEIDGTRYPTTQTEIDQMVKNGFRQAL